MRTIFLLLAGLVACVNETTAPKAAVVTDKPAFTVAPTNVTATVVACSGKYATFQLTWVSDPATVATTIEISTQGTRDRAGHPFSGSFISRTNSYSNVLKFGVYDVYLTAWSDNGAGGLTPQTTGPITLDATRGACPTGRA